MSERLLVGTAVAVPSRTSLDVTSILLDLIMPPKTVMYI